VSNLLVNPANTIESLNGKTLTELLKDPQEFLNRIRGELIRPVFDGNRQEGGTQTIETQTDKRIQETPSLIIPPRNNRRRNLIDDDEDFSFRPYLDQLF